MRLRTAIDRQVLGYLLIAVACALLAVTLWLAWRASEVHPGHSLPCCVHIVTTDRSTHELDLNSIVIALIGAIPATIAAVSGLIMVLRDRPRRRRGADRRPRWWPRRDTRRRASRTRAAPTRRRP